MDDVFDPPYEIPYEPPELIDGGEAEPTSVVALAVVVVGLYGAVYTVGVVAFAAYAAVAPWG